MRAEISSVDIVFMNSWSIDTIYYKKQLSKENDFFFFMISIFLSMSRIERLKIKNE